MADFRERLTQRDLLLTSFCIELLAPAVAEAFAQAGFDALIIDTEHSAFSLNQVSAHVVSCRAAGIAPIIRVADHSRSSLTRAADMRPAGLMVPGVESLSQAQAIVDCVRYVPRGTRGVCPMLQYERISDDRYDRLNGELALILQIEGVGGLTDARAIAELSDVDALFVGSYDLSHALGVPGQIEHHRVIESGRSLRETLPANTALGAYVSTRSGATAWANLGATLIAYATDALALLAGASAAANTVMAAFDQTQAPRSSTGRNRPR